MLDFLLQQPMHETLIGRRPEYYNERDAVAQSRKCTTLYKRAHRFVR
jgi:hypothetical protein